MWGYALRLVISETRGMGEYGAAGGFSEIQYLRAERVSASWSSTNASVHTEAF